MKTYTIGHRYLNGEIELTGTLAELVRGCGYTLLNGNTHDARISTNPKTIKALINALNRSSQVTGRYHDYYWLKSN